MVRDVVQETMAADYEAIRMSAEVLGALEDLRTYMFQNLYLIPQIRTPRLDDDFVHHLG